MILWSPTREGPGYATDHFKFQKNLYKFNINVPLTDNKRQAQIDEENWVKVTNYGEAFMRIKDATGVSDINVSTTCAWAMYKTPQIRLQCRSRLI